MAARLIYDVNIGRQHEKERVYRHLELDYDEEEFRGRFRFSKENVTYITNLLEPALFRPTLRSYAIPAETQVMLALRYLGTGSPMKVIGDTMGYHISSVSRAVRDVSSALCEIANTFINWPTSSAEKNTIKQGFYEIGQFPGVIGAIDCTHVRLQSPSGGNEYAYVNRKGFHSINVQGVCDHRGRFMHINNNWPGSCHDSFIFRTSNLSTLLEASHRGFDLDGVLLGDSGYACKKYLVTPYLNPVTQPQIRYNSSHTKTRAVIERCFGWLKRRFQVLHGEIKTRPDRVVNIITACAVLHNIAIDRREPMEDVQWQDQNIPEEPDHVDDTRFVRDYITNAYFTQ